MWNALPATEKAKYLKMQADDAIRHQKQLDEIKSQGYFLMEDGKKSNEVAHKIKKGKVVAKCLNCTKSDKKLVVARADLTKSEKKIALAQEKLTFTKEQFSSTKSKLLKEVEKYKAIAA